MRDASRIWFAKRTWSVGLVDPVFWVFKILNTKTINNVAATVLEVTRPLPCFNRSNPIMTRFLKGEWNKRIMITPISIPRIVNKRGVIFSCLFSNRFQTNEIKRWLKKRENGDEEWWISYNSVFFSVFGAVIFHSKLASQWKNHILSWKLVLWITLDLVSHIGQWVIKKTHGLGRWPPLHFGGVPT